MIYNDLILGGCHLDSASGASMGGVAMNATPLLGVL